MCFSQCGFTGESLSEQGASCHISESETFQNVLRKLTWNRSINIHQPSGLFVNQLKVFGEGTLTQNHKPLSDVTDQLTSVFRICKDFNNPAGKKKKARQYSITRETGLPTCTKPIWIFPQKSATTQNRI